MINFIMNKLYVRHIINRLRFAAAVHIPSVEKQINISEIINITNHNPV